MSKVNKVRTSITIDPNVLEAARAAVADPHSSYKSVASLIEEALKEKVGSQSVAPVEVMSAPVDAE